MTLPDLALVGYKRSGKDTTADYLAEKYGYYVYSFADKLRDLAWELDATILGTLTYRAYVDRYGYDAAKDFPEFRQHLKDLGLACRNTFGSNFWVNHLYADLEAAVGPVVITDVRFPNEFREAAHHSFVLVAISADSDDANDAHPSERDIGKLKKKCDKQLFNPKTDELFTSIDRMVTTLC